jgi:hypothetical protein
MHQNPRYEVGKITDFLGLDVNQKIIKTAIKKSNFKSMRKIELKKGRRRETPGFLVTRRGKTGDGLNALKKYKELNSYMKKEVKKSPLLHFLYGC